MHLQFYQEGENWSNAILIQIWFPSFFLKEKSFGNLPNSWKISRKKFVTIRFWLHYQWNNHLRSIRFKWLTLECSFWLIWYSNPPNILENIYSEIENTSICYQSILHITVKVTQRKTFLEFLQFKMTSHFKNWQGKDTILSENAMIMSFYK